MRRIKSCLSEMVSFTRWLYHYLKNGRTSSLEIMNDKVVIVGNGPSLCDLPVDKMIDAKFEFCCVNFFAGNSPLFWKIKPKYYCCVDPGLFTNDFALSDDGKIFYSNLQKVDWEFHLITCDGRRFPINNDNIVYESINSNVYDGDFGKYRNRLFVRNKATCGYQGVVVAALYYFITRKAKEILLVGTDNDWHRELFVDENNDVIREDAHFYGQRKLNLTQIGEIKKGELYKYFYFYYVTLKQYSILAKYAEYNNVHVVNTCMKSYIDSFTKNDLDVCLLTSDLR